MSLINDALVDLERRNADEQTAQARIRLETMHAAKPSPNRRLALALSLTGVVAVAVFLSPWRAYQSTSVSDSEREDTQNLTLKRHTSSIAESKQDSAVQTHSTALAQITPTDSLKAIENAHGEANRSEVKQGHVKQAENRQAVLSTHSISESDILVKRSALISSLLKHAEQALNNMRLTKPQGGSAHYYFNEVLSLDSQNSAALAGLHKIKRRYVELYQGALNHKNVGQAQAYRDRLHLLLDESNRQAYLRELSEIREAANISAVNQAEMAQADTPKKTIPLAFQNNSEPENNSVPNTNAAIGDSRADPIQADRVEVNIQKSDTQREKEFLEKINTFIEQGERAFAQAQLEDALEHQRYSGEVEARLMRLYFSQGAYQSVLDLAEQLESTRAHHAHFYAEAVQAMQGPRAAFHFLEEGYGQNVRAQAMHAGLLHKYQRYPEAERLYFSLTERRPEYAVHWLGLAVARDKQAKASAAAFAYRRALQLGGHSAKVQQFIQQRITLLSSEKTKVELSQW